MWKWVKWRRVTVEPRLSHFMALRKSDTSGLSRSPSYFWAQADVALCQRPSHFWTQAGMALNQSPSHFWTHAGMALRSVRVPRPAGSSFTYRNAAPYRPASACSVGVQAFKCIGSQVVAHQPCRLPLPVGWMFPVGKGGDRAAGGGHGRKHLPRWQRRAQESAYPYTPLALAYKNLCVTDPHTFLE
jgi:hypothetical protein